MREASPKETSQSPVVEVYTETSQTTKMNELIALEGNFAGAKDYTVKP